MIPQGNAIEKIHTKTVWCATSEGQKEVKLVPLNSRCGGLRESRKPNKKTF